jgi:hypothetical protein
MATTVKNIKKGQVLLVNAKGVSGGKIQLEFAEIIKSPFAKTNNSKSLTARANASDERFQQEKPRRGWLTGVPKDLSELLGMELEEMAKGEITEFNVLDPLVDGERVRLEIIETTEPNDYQASNIDKTAKKAGKDGDYIMHGGEHIFSNAVVIVGEPEHVFLQADSDEIEATVSASGLSV